MGKPVNIEKDYNAYPHNDEKRGLPRNDTFPVREKNILPEDVYEDQNTNDPTAYQWKTREDIVDLVNLEDNGSEDEVLDYDQKLERALYGEEKSLEEEYGLEISENQQERHMKPKPKINGMEIDSIKVREINTSVIVKDSENREHNRLTFEQELMKGIRKNKGMNVQKSETINDKRKTG